MIDDDFTYDDLTTMVDAYLICGLWSTMMDDPTGSGRHGHLDDWFDINDCQNRDDAEQVCEDFATDNYDLLHGAYNGDIDWGQVGHDFLLTRDRHGTGFWDRGHGPVGELLTEACRPYGDSMFMPDGYREASDDELHFADGYYDGKNLHIDDADEYRYVVDTSAGFRVHV